MENDKIGIGEIGRDQFVTADFRLLDSELIGSDEKILYLMLKRFKNRTQGYCYPSLQTLENKLNWSRKTLLKKIDNLCDVGLIKKISSNSPKQNNKYIIFPTEVVLGGKQLDINSLTEDEQEMLGEVQEGQLIKNEKTGKIMFCASEKLAFYLKVIYRRIEIYAETIKNSSTYEETQVIIEDIKRFYEGIASCPFVILDKRITDDCEKIDSEKYLETVKDFDFESIVEIVRKVKLEGLPPEFEKCSTNLYILSYLWAKKKVILENAIARKIDETSKNVTNKMS